MASSARALEEKLAEGQPKGFPFGDFDVMDVMLPEGDDMDIPSDDEEEEEDITNETGFGNIVGK
jgi:translation initiation factor 3 subunit B